jgi:amino-acid N-acetyltransferase
VTFTIAPASDTDPAPILALLERTDLPPDGLRHHLATTLVARSDSAIVGCAGVELYGAAALLRSVAVEPSHQGQGLGQRLTQAALDLARQHGAREVYLLTTTAGAFFPRFGFEPVTRADVPAAVQQSVEFTSACPVSALVMRLRLDG